VGQRAIDVSAPIGPHTTTTIHRSDESGIAGWQLVGLRIVTWTWLLLVLSVGSVGLVSVYRDPSLIRIEDFSTLYERVGLGDEVMLTVVLALPLAVALASAAVVAIRRSSDHAALLLAMGLTAVYFFTSGAATGLDQIWLRNLASSMAAVLIAVFLVTFPSGSFQPRWSIAAPLVAVAIAVAFPSLAMNTRRYLASPSLVTDGVPVAVWGGWMLILSIAAIAQFTRYRRLSTGIERDQSRWVLLGTFGMLASPAALLMLNAADLASPGLVGGLILVSSVGSYLLPTTVLIAVFRYHLYDIDALISRTVTYSLVAIVVATSFAVPVLGLASTFGTSNDLVVAASTLLAAAVANPARRWIQHSVDRRFNRTRYDADIVLDGLADRLRSDVALDSVTEHLRRAVDRTVQPETTTVWIREST